MSHDGYMLLFPVYTFRSEPDGGQGLLIENNTRRPMVPSWTDEDLFARYLPRIDGPSSRRTIVEFAELAELLRSVQPDVQHLTVDALPDAQRILVWEIDGFLASIRFDDA